MTREDIIRELEVKGFNVEMKDTVKNGVICKGILVHDEKDVNPLIYTEQMIQEAEKRKKTLEEVVDEFIKVYENSKDCMKMEIQNLMNHDWVMKHLSIAIQKSSDENLVKHDLDNFTGMEAYLLLMENGKEDESYSMKIETCHLKQWNISEQEAWETAYKHICEETHIVGMSQMMSELFGAPVEEEEDDMMYVISNSDKMKGASAILNEKALKEFAQKKGVARLYVLPSSVHEMIIIPDNGEFDLSVLSEMVSEVNNTEVKPEEQLPSRAYLLEF